MKKMTRFVRVPSFHSRLLLILPLLFVQRLPSTNAFDIHGKTALVTGASGGIGAGIAKRLAEEGANVWIHYNERLEGAKSTQAAIQDRALGIVSCDFRDNDNIRKMVDLLLKQGPIDILVNNAGLVTKSAIEDDDDDLSLWHETLQVNVHAPLLLSKLVHNSMKENVGGGVIINVSSIHGERSVERMGAYAASKAALNSMTRTLASEWAEDGIRVNAVAPGVVPVERTERLFTQKVTDMWLNHLPLDKLGTVQEIAAATIPLITNDWVTGTIWTIDGGMMSRSNMPIRPKPPAPRQRGDNSVCNEVHLDKRA